MPSATSLSFGETTDGLPLLGIEVGCIELMVSVPRSAIADVARAMLVATADTGSVT